MTGATLLWGALFSSIGLGYCIYGKRQRDPAALLCGVGLIAYPYFVPNVVALVAIGVALCAIPYFLRD